MTNDDTIGALNDLVETCKDGEYGFSRCAEHARSEALKDILRRHAEECRQAGAELQALVVDCGGRPSDSGSASGALHRGWVSVKGVLAGHSDAMMLEECERGEDVALARYRDCLEADRFPPAVRAVVQRQFDGVKRNHAEVRTLRDHARAGH